MKNANAPLRECDKAQSKTPELPSQFLVGDELTTMFPRFGILTIHDTAKSFCVHAPLSFSFRRRFSSLEVFYFVLYCRQFEPGVFQPALR